MRAEGSVSALHQYCKRILLQTVLKSDVNSHTCLCRQAGRTFNELRHRLDELVVLFLPILFGVERESRFHTSIPVVVTNVDILLSEDCLTNVVQESVRAPFFPLLDRIVGERLNEGISSL